ncbi:MAG: transcriptional regulator [Acholeplasma sp.]|nr:transcriptional regulator [Acholeplasma sp.]
MIYNELAKDFFETMHMINQIHAQRRIANAFGGGRFILQLLYLKNEAVSPGDISSEMNISTARVATALNMLEEKKYIIRKIDKQDRRRILVELTQLGIDAAQGIVNRIIAETASLLSVIGEEDALEVNRIMKKIAVYLDGERNKSV